jgi:hypothetical protein
MLIGLIVGIISFSTTVSGLTIDTQIASSSDDAEEQSAGNVKVTSSMLDLIEDGGVMQIVGMRFANLNIPKNAHIIKAYIQFTAKRASSVSTNLIIQGEHVANPNPFNGTRLNLSSRIKTTESVNWSPQAWSKGSVSQTSDIGSIVQSLVNQSDWSSGNAMAFIVSGVGQRVAVSYDGLANNAPTLHIEYTNGSTPPPIIDTTPPIITLNGDSVNLDDVLLILNKYNSNGGSWLEMVVVGTHVDLSGATLKIKESGSVTFEGTIPAQVQLGHLRRGTLITISEEPTDMSYAPFSANDDDWVLNLNSNDLTNKKGHFEINSNTVSVEIIAKGKSILAESGEGISFDALRLNRDLDEIGGIVLSDITDLVGLKDAESLLYVPINNSLWIADDNAHKVYEMDFSSKEVKAIYTATMLKAFSGVTQLNDIESIVYDDISDTLYIFVGSSSSQPAIFRLTRKHHTDSFVFGDNDPSTLDFRLLNNEYQAVQFVEGEMIIASGYNLFAYDFKTDKKSSVRFTSSGTHGKIYGMAYDGSGSVWLVTSKNYLLKVDWSSKKLVATYQMADKDSIETYNGVYDTRGLEIINDEVYILEGMNQVGSKGATKAPYGNALKNSIHIYTMPDDNL